MAGAIGEPDRIYAVFWVFGDLISEVMTKLRSSSVELRLIYIKADVNDYDEDIKLMSNFTKEEFVQILRRQSTRFARGSSNFRGVTLHNYGRWEACMGQLLGKKEYDQAAIKCHGREAITNFNPSSYDGELVIEASNAGTHYKTLLFYLQSKNSVPGPPTTVRTQLPYGSMGASVEPPLMSSMNSNFIPIQMERATEKRMDANSFPSGHGNCKAIMMEQLHCHASLLHHHQDSLLQLHHHQLSSLHFISPASLFTICKGKVM